MTFMLMLSQWFRGASEVSTENQLIWEIWRAVWHRWWKNSTLHQKLWLATIDQL